MSEQDKRDKEATKAAEKNVKQNAGAGQTEKASQAQEGPQPKQQGTGRVPGRAITEDEPAPMADQVFDEKLEQFKKSKKDSEEE